MAWADYVFLSAMSIQQGSARQVIDRCKQAGVKIVAGGPLLTSGLNAFRNVDLLVLASTRKPHNTSRNEARSL